LSGGILSLTPSYFASVPRKQLRVKYPEGGQATHGNNFEVVKSSFEITSLNRSNNALQAATFLKTQFSTCSRHLVAVDNQSHLYVFTNVTATEPFRMDHVHIFRIEDLHELTGVGGNMISVQTEDATLVLTVKWGPDELAKTSEADDMITSVLSIKSHITDLECLGLCQSALWFNEVEFHTDNQLSTVCLDLSADVRH